MAEPTLLTAFVDDGDEAWLGSPAITDLDGDGQPDFVVARGGTVFAWKKDGTRIFAFKTKVDRIWASPAIAKIDDQPVVIVAARDSAWIVDKTGQPRAGFPVKWGSEIRSMAVGDVDGDGKIDVVVGAKKGGDIVNAFKADGSIVAGFPPVESGKAGCTPGPCYFAGLYDQNIALGDLNGDGKADVVAPHDNAYASFISGTGEVFPSSAVYAKATRTAGVRYLHTLSQAIQGYADDEEKENQAHFTNTAPAIADVDGDGKLDVVMLGSVQNAAQSDRLRGVGLWLVHPDASRIWDTPFVADKYVVGLGDGFTHGLEGDAISGADNLVGATNQVTVAEIDPSHPGLEMIFAGFDGRIHAVASDKKELWSTPYAENGRALTGGVVVADLSADGVPEIVFTTYSPDQGGGALFVLSASGQVLHTVKLPKRGSMAVPSIGEVDGALVIAVSLKDAAENNESVQLYSVASSKPNCLLWPTGRANLLRNGVYR